MPDAASQPREVHLDPLQILPRIEWDACRPVLETLNQRNIQYAVGGGLVVILYGGHARSTKDMDIFIDPRDSEAVVDVMHEHGFADMYERQKYRRDWLYRGINGEVIFDAIWSMANRRADIDASWLKHVQHLEVDGVRLPLMAPEELVFAKVYVMHRDRCDWPDLLNLLNMQAGTMDWDRILERAKDDWLLLTGLLSVFRWLCPKASEAVPAATLEKLGLTQVWARPTTGEGDEGARATLLDSYRDWFGPLKPEEIVERRMG